MCQVDLALLFYQFEKIIWKQFSLKIVVYVLWLARVNCQVWLLSEHTVPGQCSRWWHTWQLCLQCNATNQQIVTNNHLNIIALRLRLNLQQTGKVLESALALFGWLQQNWLDAMKLFTNYIVLILSQASVTIDANHSIDLITITIMSEVPDDAVCPPRTISLYHIVWFCSEDLLSHPLDNMLQVLEDTDGQHENETPEGNKYESVAWV